MPQTGLLLTFHLTNKEIVTFHLTNKEIKEKVLLCVGGAQHAYYEEPAGRGHVGYSPRKIKSTDDISRKCQ